jgi:hypothetical protein
MALITGKYHRARTYTRLLGGLFAVAFSITPAIYAQDQGRYRDGDRYNDRDRDYDRGAVQRVDPGTTIPVRVNQAIDIDKGDNRVYTGTVEQDVRGEGGRVVIPRGSQAQMMVRYARDNDLNLDLEAIIVNGQRYGVRSDRQHIESQKDNSLVGTIVGAINGGEVQGRAVRVPRDSVVTFQLAQPLEMGAPPRYGDRYDQDRNRYDQDRDRYNQDRDHYDRDR